MHGLIDYECTTSDRGSHFITNCCRDGRGLGMVVVSYVYNSENDNYDLENESRLGDLSTEFN